MRIFEQENGRLGYDVRFGPSGPDQLRTRTLTEFVKGQEREVLLLAAKALSQLEQTAKVKAGEARLEHTWGEAVHRYILEKTQSDKLSLDKDIAKFIWIEEHNPGVSDVLLKDINRYWVDQNIRNPLQQAGLKKSTINRYLEVINHLLNLACMEWEDEGGLTWLENAPKLRREKLSKREKKRVRWLTKQEADRLLKELPVHLKPIFKFGLNTGLRTANLRDMEWEQVDLTRKVVWVHPDSAKSGNAISVPLNDEAIEVVRNQIGKNHRYVFTNNYGRHITGDFTTKAWYKALDRVGIRKYARNDDPRYPIHPDSEYKYDSFSWHDGTRHTWATWHIMGGTPIEVLQELGGWSSIEMVRKYAYFAPGHNAKFANNAINGAAASDKIGVRGNNNFGKLREVSNG